MPQDGQGHVVDLLESGATVSSFVEEYALATNVEPSVSATYLLMSLVPQCRSHAAKQLAAQVPAAGLSGVF